MPEVLDRLRADRPLFHSLTAEAVRSLIPLGFDVQAGDVSWAVAPRALRWIADHVAPKMVTLETGAGYTTVVLAALAHHHTCCTLMASEEEKIRPYLRQIGVPEEKVTFWIGSSDQSLPRLDPALRLDFAYIDGCHGVPFPALDWHYIDLHMNVGGIIGMDNAELRPVREHCEFLEEDGSYRLVEEVADGYLVRFYEKLRDENREWISQPYSKAKRDPCDGTFRTRVRRRVSRWLKPFLY
jgi:predicted O-methyltransferase YrrM